MFESYAPASANDHHHEYYPTDPSSSVCVPITSRSMSTRFFIKKSLSYQKIPQPPLSLSVIKLDGSTFELQIPRTATVAKLIEAVKDVFDRSVNDDETISWSHVWSQFCLCYNGEKLLNYKAYIRLFGIKDGDQLRRFEEAGRTYCVFCKCIHC